MVFIFCAGIGRSGPGDQGAIHAGVYLEVYGMGNQDAPIGSQSDKWKKAFDRGFVVYECMNLKSVCIWLSTIVVIMQFVANCGDAFTKVENTENVFFLLCRVSCALSNLL